jgi:hypothetical protein
MSYKLALLLVSVFLFAAVVIDDDPEPVKSATSPGVVVDDGVPF